MEDRHRCEVWYESGDLWTEGYFVMMGNGPGGGDDLKYTAFDGETIHLESGWYLERVQSKKE